MTIVMIPIKNLLAPTSVKRFSRKPSQSVSRIKHSIFKDGLLNPLIVMKQEGNYQVIDGKKRLSAIKQLASSQKRSRKNSKIPCIIHDCDQLTLDGPKRPILLSSPELAHAILSEIDSGLSPVSIAQRFECDYGVIDDAVSLRKLHPKLLQHFNNQALSLEQAAAFATIDNPKAQLNLLLQLGPFVSDEVIISEIKSGATVIEVPDGNVVILPSRKVPKRKTKEHITTASQRVFSTNIVPLHVAA